MRYKIYALALLGLFATATACKDESIELIPEWESAVHGAAEVTSASPDFLYNDPTAPIDIDLQWISIDQALTVTKIEVFLLYNENYINADGDPAVASHGGAGGRSYLVLEGGEVPANRTPTSFSISQTDAYNLYQDATFDYGNGPVNVFTNPDNPFRDPAHRFMWNDDLSVRWEYTTDDGRLFKKWGVSVCTEFPNADCSIDFTVVCASSIQNPAGTWLFDLIDTYGDGWQGGKIEVWVDNAKVDEIFLLSEYDPGGVPVSAGSDSYTFPATGATTLEFRWVVDDYQSETQFKITSPSGNVVADYKAGPPAGKIKLDLCLE
jgi:hypothetical protein